MMIAALLLTSGVSCINEDLSDCGKDYIIRYDVNLVTNIQTEIDEELQSLEEKELGKKLKAALSNVFSDHARDLDLTFYTPDSLLSYEETHVINSNTASYTIYLPVRDYQHTALANDDHESNVRVVGRDHASRFAWEQIAGDTLPSYTQGLFSARQKMEVKDQSQEFHVQMYMANSAAAVVINMNHVKIDGMRGVMAHMADGFSIRDSLFHYHDRTLIRVNELADTGDHLKCLYGVSLPSRNAPEASAPHRGADAAEGSVWEYRIYVDMPDGKVTATTLHIREVLPAGNLKIIKLEMQPDGSLVTDAPEVGASVELDWKEGGEYNPEL